MGDDTNPKDKIGLTKVPLSLVPPSSIIYQALGMSDGKRKYGPYNWRSKKVIASIYVDAALRHILSWNDGEENASDSGMPHLGHALACLGIIVDALETGNLIDDRPVPGTCAALLARFTQKINTAAGIQPEKLDVAEGGVALHTQPGGITQMTACGGFVPQIHHPGHCTNCGWPEERHSPSQPWPHSTSPDLLKKPGP